MSYLGVESQAHMVFLHWCLLSPQSYYSNHFVFQVQIHTFSVSPVSPNRTLLFMNGFQHILGTRSFHLTQVQNSHGASAYKWSELVMHCWPQATVRWAIVDDVWQICALSAKHQCLLNKQPRPRKVRDAGQAPHSPLSLFFFFLHQPKPHLDLGDQSSPCLCPWSVIFVMCLNICNRLPEVCGSRDLSRVSGCCHTIWHHFGTTWRLYEVVIFLFYLFKAESLNVPTNSPFTAETEPAISVT